MLKRLKNKFILINMLTVGVILLIIVLSITIINYNQRMKFAEESVRMQSLVDATPVFPNKPPPVFDSNLEISNGTLSNLMSRAYTITAYVYKNGEIAIMQNYLDGYTTEEFIQLINKIMQLEENQGRAYGVFYGKRKISEPLAIDQYDFEYQVVIAPISVIKREIQGTLFIGLSVVFGAMCIFYFISKKLADVAVKPTEDVWNKQKRFIQDASHDLKTPLTVIMANNEILLSHTNEEDQDRKKWLESTKIEGEHMKELINQMLDLARSESLVTSIELEEVNISEVSEMTSLQLEPIAYEKNVMIEAEIEKDIIIKSNKNEFTRLLYILVDNAIKYAPSESKVTITLQKNKKHTTLCVNNKGKSISNDDLPYIFDRFYRTDSARTKGGFGLGLSIAKNIVIALNGEISVSSNDTDGTTFMVKLK